MIAPITIILPGIPIAKARHRSFLRGKRICIYDSQETKKKDVSMQMMAQTGVLPFGDSKYFEVDFEFFFPIPDSYSKRKKEQLTSQYHNVRPDLDNILKFYLDTANGILWKDDRSISKISCVKVYGENPQTIITFFGKN